jgi:hypothetical protein
MWKNGGCAAWLLIAMAWPALVHSEEAVSPAELVARLGDESFSVREAAARELARLGLASKDALTAGAMQGDLEVRLRCQELLQAMLRNDLEKRLAAFLADSEGKGKHDLPGWERFRKRCGNERPARELFAELVRSEAGLLEALDAKAPGLSQMFNERVDSLQQYYYSGRREQISAATVAALLLVGVEPDVQIDVQVGFIMYNFLSQSNSTQALSEGPQSETLRGLLEAWVARGNHESLGYYNLMLALRYNLKDAGLALGRKVIATHGASPNALQNAAIAVGKYGNKDDRKLLEPLLNNTTVCHTWSNPQFKNLIKTEIRDVALVMLLRMTEQEPKDYGFNLLQPTPITVYQIYSFGFPEQADRDAALGKWNAWAAAQK